MVTVWPPLLVLASLLGRATRWIFVDGRGVTVPLALVPAGYLALKGKWDEAAIAGALWLFILFFVAALGARKRFVIGDFKSPESQESSGPPAATPVDFANLLQVEISRLADLFRVVADRRAVTSGLTDQRGLDATLSVDDLVEKLQGTISSETKAAVGPVTIPLAPFVTLFAKLLQAPRLTGTLHRDGGVLILTAQTGGRGGLSWRVKAPLAVREPAADEVVSDMVEELALRIYTDLALGRAVRWQASRSFVYGLHRFRACLRTPKERKLNLKKAEEGFLTALAEDEDFPLVYYNLGVVYTELHGLAVAAGRAEETRTRLSAAETAFGRAIEKDPTRWECHFAFAQTQFRHGRYGSVIELCGHMAELDLGRADRAKTEELWARALLERAESRDYREAVRHARCASRLALRSLALARLRRRPSARGEDDHESRCAELASGCLLTFSRIYSRQIESTPRDDSRFSNHERIRRRVQSVAKLAPLKHGEAELRFDFGWRALQVGDSALAEEELGKAVRSDPTRPSYSAALALARATRLSADGRKITANEREEIVGRCLRALQGMAGEFFPSRDARACNILGAVYDRLGSESHGDGKTAAQLREIAAELERRLEDAADGASVSGIFLEVLQTTEGPLASKVGAYGDAAQRGRAHLAEGQDLSQGEDRAKDGEHRAKALAEFRQALQCAERATSLNPLSTLAWETFGDVHRELRDFQNARTAWTQALGTDPDNPRLHDKIGSSYWHIAFEGRTRASREDLAEAAGHFDKALLLYGTGRFHEGVLTHYRLAKLNAGLKEFAEARRHLEIVEAVQPEDRPPLVGWVLMGFGHLEERNFSECEYYFGKVVREANRLKWWPTKVIGDRLDEQLWPFNLIRAWGHLGLAITFAERDGDLTQADAHVDAADALLESLELDESDPTNDERFPTRAPAAVIECRGLIRLRDAEVDEAIERLEEAVRIFPHSRAYLELAVAHEQSARAHAASRDDIIPRAERLLAHAVRLGPTVEPSAEVKEAMERLARLKEQDGQPVA